MLGKKISPLGEMKIPNQFYLKQIAATVTELLGEKFEADHPVASALQFPK